MPSKTVNRGHESGLGRKSPGWTRWALPPGFIVSLHEAGKQIASVWIHTCVKKKKKMPNRFWFLSFLWRTWQILHAAMMFCLLAVVFTIRQSFGPCYFNEVGLWLWQKSCASPPCWFWRMKAPNCNMTRGSVVLRWSWRCTCRVRRWSDQGGTGLSTQRRGMQDLMGKLF